MIGALMQVAVHPVMMQLKLVKKMKEELVYCKHLATLLYHPHHCSCRQGHFVVLLLLLIKLILQPFTLDHSSMCLIREKKCMKK